MINKETAYVVEDLRPSQTAVETLRRQDEFPSTEPKDEVMQSKNPKQILSNKHQDA